MCKIRYVCSYAMLCLGLSSTKMFILSFRLCNANLPTDKYFATANLRKKHSALANKYQYFSTHCNTSQIWSCCTEYSSSVVNRYPSIYVTSCVGEKNGKIKIISSFSAMNLRFVINVLNNKTNLLLNRTVYPLILANIRRYSARFRRIIVKYRPNKLVQ